MRRLLARHPAILATLAVVLALLLHGALVEAEERATPFVIDGGALVAEPSSISLIVEEVKPTLVPRGLLRKVLRKSAVSRDLNLEPYLRVDETLPLVTFGAFADWWSTEHLLDAKLQGLYEGNPFGPSIGKRGAMQLLHIGATVMVVHEVDRSFGRRWGKRTLWTATAIKGLIAARHMWLARKYGIPLLPKGTR